MPRKATTSQTRHQEVAGAPQGSQARPDAGARKAAKKLRDLQATAKQLTPVVPPAPQLAAMSTKKLLATLQELVHVEAVYLSQSLDPRPIKEGQGFRILLRNNPLGFDPAQDPKYRSARRSRKDPPPPPPAAPPQPPAELPSQAIAEERSIRARR